MSIYSIELALCELINRSIQSFRNLYEIFIEFTGFNEYFISFLLGVVISLLGVNKIFRNITIFSIILLDLLYLIGFILVNYDIKILTVEFDSLMLLFEPVLLATNSFLSFLLVSNLLRIIEYNYGPARISDIDANLLSINYLSRYSLRKIRQFQEFISFSIIPAMFIQWFRTKHSIYLMKSYHNHVCNGSLTIISFEYNNIHGFVLTTLVCVTFQRVFGSNPSYKPSIEHQYGEALSGSISQSNSSSDLSTPQSTETNTNSDSPKKNVSKRRPPTEIYSLIGGLPDVDRARKNIKSKEN